MNKEIKFADNLKAVKVGVDTAGDFVKITLGPRGRNIIIDSQNIEHGMPEITNDGVTILENIFLKDRFANMGVKLAKECARKTDKNAKDGTTTTTVILQAIIEEGMKVMHSTVSPIIMGDGIMHAVKLVEEELIKIAIPVTTDEMRKQVAYISSENKEMAEVVADVIKEVGDKGIVSFEESDKVGFSYEMVNGMQVDKGFCSPFMITRNDKMLAEYSDVHVLVTDKKIMTSEGLITKVNDGLIQKLIGKGIKKLVIIAEDVDGEALQTLLLNRSRGIFNALAVKAPGYGAENKKDLLEDIAAKVGATIITDHSGLTFDKVTVEMLGHARSVSATEYTTVITGGNNIKTAERVAELYIKNQEKPSPSIDGRIAKLEGKVAVISYGAENDTRLKYLKRKLEDTVGTVQSAVAEGIVPGGGSALVQACARVKNAIEGERFDNEFELGMNVLFKALNSPITNIIKNAGKEDDVLSIIEWSKTLNHGYDAKTHTKVENMIEEGITDAVKVTRNALINAARTASDLLTTGGGMTNEVEEKK